MLGPLSGLTPPLLLNNMEDFKRFWKAIIYTWLWNCSIFGGYLFFATLVPLLIFAPRIYRKIVDFVVTFWQFYVTTFLTKACGCNIQVTGDAVNSDETSILISNHRTRVDWNFLWPTMYHAVQGRNKIFCSTKFILKDSIKNIPGAALLMSTFGKTDDRTTIQTLRDIPDGASLDWSWEIPCWVMQLAFYIFIYRNWEKDQRIIKNYIDYVADMAYKHILILFPEGTDLTIRTKDSSDKYAESNGYPKYKHVLHPRTTGFTYLVDQMKRRKCVDAIYDVTLIYPDDCPQNEEELFFHGKFPKKVMAHLVRYPISMLPDTKEGLKEFLEQRWLEKEKTIEEFRSTGRFLHGKILNQTPSCMWYVFTFIFWSIVPFLGFYLLLTNWLFLFIVTCHTLILIGLQWMPIGGQSFDMLFFKIRKFCFGEKNYLD